MNRKIIALNLALLALLGTLGWMLREHWRESRAQHLAMLAKAARGKAQLPPPSPVPPEAVVPANYLDVAQRTLFSKDRNPNVIIEVAPLPPKPPEEPTPARPEYYGQMEIGEPVVFLGGEKGSQKGFHLGDKVGPFKLVAFNRDTITFEWKDKTLKYPLEELKPKEPAPGTVEYAAPARAVAPNSTLIGPGSAQQQEEKNSGQGPQNGDTRTCVPGDNSPAGTVRNGYRKSVIPGAFGPMCQWEPVR